MDAPRTPFDRYPRGGREPLGPPRRGDETCRQGYGPPVFEVSGSSCVYCGRELLDSYDAWLSVSVDHVVPRCVAWYVNRRRWVEDIFNLVTCCRACNEFLNRYKCGVPEPGSEQEFTAIRDRVFVEKREQAIRRHGAERRWYDIWIKSRGGRT